MTVTSPSLGGLLDRWGALIALCLTMFIIVLDTSMMNVAVPQIAEDLGTTISGVQSVIALYSLVMASLMLAGAKLGTIYGARRVFRIALIVYGVGTLLATFSWSIGILGLGWSVIEGIGAAALLPLSMSLVVVNYQGAERALAFGVLGGFQAAAAALGPIVGGILTQYVTWRAGFAIEVIIVGVVLTMVGRLKEPAADRSQQLDVIGTMLSVLAFGSIVVASLLAGRYGWWNARRPFTVAGVVIGPLGLSITPVLLVVGLVSLVVFAHWQRHRERVGSTPLLRLQILRNATFVNGFSIDALQSVTLAGLLFVIPVFLQQGLGFSPLSAGVVLLPLSITVLGVSMGSASLGRRFDAKYLVVVGAALMAAGIVWLAAVSATDMSGWTFLGPLVVFGTGTGLLLAQVPNLTFSSLAPEHMDEGSGVRNSVKETGTSLGTAIIGSVFLAVTMSALLGTALEARGVQVSTSARDRIVVAVEDKIDSLSPEELRRAVKALDVELGGRLPQRVAEARVEGFQEALLVVAGFVILALLGATFLPKGRLVDPNAVESEADRSRIELRAPTPGRGL